MTASFHNCKCVHKGLSGTPEHTQTPCGCLQGSRTCHIRGDFSILASPRREGLHLFILEQAQLPGAEMPRVHSALPSEVCRQGSPWQQVRPERGIFWLLADVISSYFKRHDSMHVHTDTHACTYTSVYK